MNVRNGCAIRFRGQQGWCSLTAISKECWQKEKDLLCKAIGRDTGVKQQRSVGPS